MSESEPPITVGKFRRRLNLFGWLRPALDKVHVSLRVVRKVAIVVVLAIVIVAGIVLFQRWQSTNKANKQLAAKDIKLYNQAIVDPTPSSYATAQKALDYALGYANNAMQKSGIYIRKSSLAMSAQKYSDALTFAQKAEALYPSAGSAQSIADSYVSLGNKAEAITYYKKAISRLNPKSELDRADINDYKQTINSLGGTP